MRAKEFTINVPITITINGDDDPIVSTDQDDSQSKLQQDPVMVTPQQQELELAKAELGKESPVIDKIIQSDNIGAEPQQDDSILSRIKQLMPR